MSDTIPPELAALNAARKALWEALTPEAQERIKRDGFGESPTEQALAAVSTQRLAIMPNGASLRGKREVTAKFEVFTGPESGNRHLEAQLSPAAIRALTWSLAKVVGYIVASGGALWLALDRLLHWAESGPK